jgi:hypothetical protein
VHGPVAQTTLANATAATTTTLLTSTPSTPEGCGVAGPPTPNLVSDFGLTALISWAVLGAALIWRGQGSSKT